MSSSFVLAQQTVRTGGRSNDSLPDAHLVRRTVTQYNRRQWQESGG